MFDTVKHIRHLKDGRVNSVSSPQSRSLPYSSFHFLSWSELLCLLSGVESLNRRNPSSRHDGMRTRRPAPLSRGAYVA
jgi:hypothetical protein